MGDRIPPSKIGLIILSAMLAVSNIFGSLSVDVYLYSKSSVIYIHKKMKLKLKKQSFKLVSKPVVLGSLNIRL